MAASWPTLVCQLQVMVVTTPGALTRCTAVARPKWPPGSGKSAAQRTLVRPHGCSEAGLRPGKAGWSAENGPEDRRKAFSNASPGSKLNATGRAVVGQLAVSHRHECVDNWHRDE